MLSFTDKSKLEDRSPKEAVLELLSARLNCHLEDVSFLFEPALYSSFKDEIEIPDVRMDV